MAARTGSEYIERPAASSPTVQIHGETVTTGIPDHPAFRNVVRRTRTSTTSSMTPSTATRSPTSPPPPATGSGPHSWSRGPPRTWSSVAR